MDIGARQIRVRLTALLLIAALPAQAQTVTDGDTIRHQDTTYRLWGIDAPENAQTCGDWPAGRLATTHLQSLMAGRRITCEAKTTDRYGRTVAVCRANGADLGERMVRDGYAWAFTRYSRDYEHQEASARAEHRGVHAHACIPAWEWRATNRR